MKYNVPYGKPEEVTEGDQPYINGDPSIARAGSIPPAASIEFPQREIVHVIGRTGQAPNNSDLYQLGRGIQSMLLNCNDDTGTANAYATNLPIAPLAYFKYLMVILKIANTNTGPSVMNVNSLGNKNIVNSDLSPISASTLRANMLACLQYDGTQFQVVWAAQQQLGTGTPIYLTTPKTYYVNGNTGNDNYDGLSAAYSTGIHGPFLTLQAASNAMRIYNLNGYSITVYVADYGAYAAVFLPPMFGAGNVHWIGNSASPPNCVIHGVNSSCVIGSNVGSAHTMEGFLLTASGVNVGPGVSGINLQGVTFVAVKNMQWGACVGAHNIVAYGSQLNFDGTLTVSGGAAGQQGHPGAFICTLFNGQATYANGGSPPTLNIIAAVSYAASFVYADNLSYIQLSFGSITGSANVTGQKYLASANAVIRSGGTIYPGTVGGVMQYGGQYI